LPWRWWCGIPACSAREDLQIWTQSLCARSHTSGSPLTGPVCESERGRDSECVNIAYNYTHVISSLISLDSFLTQNNTIKKWIILGNNVTTQQHLAIVDLHWSELLHGLSVVNSLSRLPTQRKRDQKEISPHCNQHICQHTCIYIRVHK
jgi:hypothetical protein